MELYDNVVSTDDLAVLLVSSVSTLLTAGLLELWAAYELACVTTTSGNIESPDPSCNTHVAYYKQWNLNKFDNKMLNASSNDFCKSRNFDSNFFRLIITQLLSALKSKICCMLVWAFIDDKNT